jgi:RNA polymerase sigma-32 factor
MKTWSLVKIGTTQSEKKLFYKIGKVRKALESTQEEEEKYQRVALDLAVAEKDVIEMEERMSSRDPSLDAAFDENNELTGLDLLQENSLSQEELLAQEKERKLQAQRILHAIKCLNEKEVYVIKNRVMADEPLTLQQIADHLKLSRERVRQIESEALARLKRELTHPSAHPTPDQLYDPKPTVESSTLS